MKTFKSFVYKEHIEYIKQSRYIILSVGVILFAILDPMMLKLLPKLLANQANVEMPADMFSPGMAINNYIKDLTQITLIFVIFSFAGTLLGEIRNQKLMLPYSKGAVPSEIVLAKVFVFFATLFVLSFFGLIINYFYVWYIFEKPEISIWSLFNTLIAVNLFYWIYASFTLLLSSFLKKATSVGIIVLLSSFSMGMISMVWSAGKDFIPGRLVDAAYMQSLEGAGAIILISLAVSSLFIFLSILRMNKIEVN